MARAIFISYRRDDTEGEAGRLFDDLVRTFGAGSVFMDVTDIKPGLDFRKVIDDNVATCGVLLAMIGPAWTSVTGASGQPRLQDPNDFVRLEVASALARDIPVIPVLVHGANMPHPDQLPDNLKDLAFRNNAEITHQRWNSDVQLLIDALGKYVSATSATSTEPVHATVSVQLPPANPPAHEPAPARSSKTPLFAGIAIGAVLAIAAVGFFAVQSHKKPKIPSDANAAQSQPVQAQTAVPQAPQGAPAAVPAAVPKNPLVGTWTNPTPEADNGLEKLEISADGSALVIHAWAKCQPVDCDWSVQRAKSDGQKATASWSPVQASGKHQKGRVATVTLSPQGAELSVFVLNTFPHQAANQRQFEFVRTQ